MKRKLIALLLTAIMSVSMLSACGNQNTDGSSVPVSATEAPATEPPHEHSYSESSKTAATCTDNGSVTYSCACGDSYSDTIYATGHSFGSYVYNNDATTSADGTETATCGSCGATDTRTAAGTKLTCTHANYSQHGSAAQSWWESYKGTACQVLKGYHVFSCKDCGHTWHVDFTPSSEGDYNHSYTYDEKTPTCTEGGYYTKVCACGEGNSIITYDALGHSWRTKNGGFSADGMRVETIRYCRRCDADGGSWWTDGNANYTSSDVDERYTGPTS